MKPIYITSIWLVPFVLLMSLACTLLNPAITTSTSTSWSTYNDSQWHYSINYPNTTNGKNLILIGTRGQVPKGPEELLLLSDDPNSGPQYAGQNETIRIEIWRIPSSASSFDEWSVAMSSSFRITLLSPVQAGSCPASSGRSNVGPNQAVWAQWINARDYYLGISVEEAKLENTADLEKMIASFMPEVCKE